MGLKYKGPGFLPGVPARDLTDEEAAQHGEHRLVRSGLYEKSQSGGGHDKLLRRKGRNKHSDTDWGSDEED